MTVLTPEQAFAQEQLRAGQSRMDVAGLLHEKNVSLADAFAIINEQEKVLSQQKAQPEQTADEPMEGVIDLDPPAVTAPAAEPSTALNPTDTLGYLGRLFEPGDCIDLQFIHQETKEVDDNFVTLADALKPENLQHIRKAQDEGWNSFVCMNALTTGVRHRRKKDVQNVRSVYLDFDENGDAGLAAIDADVKAGMIPEWHFILESSPQKYYVVWLVTGFTVEQQEALLSALQKRYGSDAAATDMARVLRLPGTRNLKPKYNPTPTVRIIQQGSHAERYTSADFKIEVNAREQKESAPIASEELDGIAEYMLANLDAAKVEHGVLESNGGDGYKIVLDECLWGRAEGHHQNGDPTGGAVFIHTDGKPGYLCFHDWCREHYHWAECRKELERRAGHSLQFGGPIGIPLLHGGVPVAELNERKELAEKLSSASTTTTLVVYLNPEDSARLQQEREPFQVQIQASGIQTKALGRVQVLDPAPVTSPAPVLATLDIPPSAMASSRLGDIYSSIFEPNDWPLNLALPALVTAASVLVPRFVAPEGSHIIGDDNMTNLYTALIGRVHCGKSQCAEWAAKSLGIHHEEYGEHYLDISAGSAEQLIDSLDKRKNHFKGSVLIAQDEWSQLFAKAAIPNAAFAPFLTKSFYRKRQVFSRPRGKEVVLNLSMSFIGGIVEEDFDTVFNASTLGGCYDRFLFGRMPQDWTWNYRQFPYADMLAVNELPWAPVPVSLDGSVFEVGKAWAKANPDLGRIVEICIRVATIYGSMDGRSLVTGKDLEVLWGLAQYQLDLRRQFQPNAGLNPDAQFANAATTWIEKHAQEWASVASLKNGVHAYEERLGPNVAERALYALARGGRIRLWLNTGDLVKNPPPADYNGKVPRIGLVRRAELSQKAC